jgi:DNA ligase-1
MSAHMVRFAEVCNAVASTASKNEKVRLVAEYLRSLPLDDAARAALFFTARAFPRSEERVLAVGGSIVWQTVSRLVEVDDRELEAAYRKHGDLGDMTQEVLSRTVRSSPTAGLTLLEVEAAFQQLAKRRGSAQKQGLLEDFLRRTLPQEAKYVVKILTGELRIGLKESLVEEAIAQAFHQPLAEVQRANMLTGDIGATLRLTAAGTLASASLRLFHPFGFMLASPADTLDEVVSSIPQGAQVEDKYDGIRAQAHKSGDGVKLFSRTLDEIVEFSELAAPLKAPPGEFVLDGEIVGWGNGRPLPFTQLQQRLGRKQPELFLPLEIPVSFVAFDLLYQDQEVLLDQPLTERRRRLAALLRSAPTPAIQLSGQVLCVSPEELQRAFDAALERGNEGIMAKAPDSPYLPGRRGRFWLKLKRPMATLDVVVTAVEYGHGKRHGLLSDYTFAVRAGPHLVNIGKAYSGLTDVEIIQFTEYFKQHTLEDQGFRLRVEPRVVLEVAFNNIQRSARHESGYALRFPRIVRLRSDKSVADIDDIERVKELYERQGVKPSEAT